MFLKFLFLKIFFAILIFIAPYPCIFSLLFHDHDSQQLAATGKQLEVPGIGHDRLLSVAEAWLLEEENECDRFSSIGMFTQSIVDCREESTAYYVSQVEHVTFWVVCLC